MILFVAYGGGHVAALAPLALALQRQGRPFVFLALTTARAYLAALGVPSVGFADLAGAADPQVQAYGAALAAGLPAGGPVAHEETVAYLGLSYRDLVAEHGEQEAARRYAAHGRQAFLPVATLGGAIAQFAPSLVVATNSPRAEQAAMLAARAAGVRAVCVVDLFAAHEIVWCGQPGYGDAVCVLNEAVRAQFIARGRKAEEVIVTGNPAFDRLGEAAVVAAGARMRAERGWDDGGVTLLWASQVEPDVHPFSGQPGDPTLPRRIEQRLRAFVASHPHYRLVVRYHPSERVDFAPAERVTFSPCSEPLAPLLHAVDLVVVTASTVGLEAALAGRPVIAVDASIFQADAPYSQMGIATGVDAVEELDAVIGQVAAGIGKGGASAAPLPAAAERVMQVIDHVLAWPPGGLAQRSA